MTMQSHTRLPNVVSQAEWLAASKRLLAKEKQLTRGADALAAERRRLPMVKIDKAYVFEGSAGKASLLDLFEGRRQLIVYHFMFAPGRRRLADGRLPRLLDGGRPDRPPRPPARPRHFVRPGLPRTAGQASSLSEADGLDRSVVLVRRAATSTTTSGSRPPRVKRSASASFSATATASTAPTSPTDAASRRWAPSGRSST